MSQMPQIDVQALWKYVTDQVKTQISLPNVWRAMEAACPLVIESDELILGFRLDAGYQPGLLTDSRNRNIIEQALERAARRRMRIRVIAGDTLQDWEAIKEQEREAARLQAQAKQQYQKQVEAGRNWEAVGEQLVRKFSATPNRGLPSVQARYLEESLEILVERYRQLMPASPTELDERNFSRALDRVSERVGVPSSLIAHMVLVRVQGQSP